MRLRQRQDGELFRHLQACPLHRCPREMTDTAVFLSAAVLINLVPGPSVLYVASRTLSNTFSSGVLSSVGLAVGGSVHVTLVAFGLGAALSRSPDLLFGIRCLGAAYLLYLAYTAWRGGGQATLEEAGQLPPVRCFLQGIVVEVTNPKIILFFFAFLPQFVSGYAANPYLDLLTLGLLFYALGTTVNIAYAGCATLLKRRLIVFLRARHFSYFEALMLSGIAVYVVILSLPAAEASYGGEVYSLAYRGGIESDPG